MFCGELRLSAGPMLATLSFSHFVLPETRALIRRIALIPRKLQETVLAPFRAENVP